MLTDHRNSKQRTINKTRAAGLGFVFIRIHVDSSWNVMAHGEPRRGKWWGNCRMQCVVSTLHTTSEHAVSSTISAPISVPIGRVKLLLLPGYYMVTAWLMSGYWLVTSCLLPCYLLVTNFLLPGYSLLTTFLLPVYCLVTSGLLPSYCIFTAWLLLCYCLVVSWLLPGY
jgi:hypothetical protein